MLTVDRARQSFTDRGRSQFFLPLATMQEALAVKVRSNAGSSLRKIFS
jgi:hypothetical protein